jgi:hypothetical protein
MPRKYAPLIHFHEEKIWCAREDLNLHPLRDQILSLARLPFRHSRGNRAKLPQVRSFGDAKKESENQELFSGGARSRIGPR